MLLGGMLASSLTLLLFLLVSVSFCLSPSVSAAWLWLLFLVRCPLGVLGTMRGEHPAFFEDMWERSGSHGYLALEASSRSRLYAGPQHLRFLALFRQLVYRFLSRLAASFMSLYRATSIEGHLFFVIQNSFLYYIIYFSLPSFFT